jgi:hypothetical protein
LFLKITSIDNKKEDDKLLKETSNRVQNNVSLFGEFETYFKADFLVNDLLLLKDKSDGVNYYKIIPDKINNRCLFIVIPQQEHYNFLNQVEIIDNKCLKMAKSFKLKIIINENNLEFKKKTYLFEIVEIRERWYGAEAALDSPHLKVDKSDNVRVHFQSNPKQFFFLVLSFLNLFSTNKNSAKFQS